MYVKLTVEPVSLQEAIERVDLTGRGALVTFSGHIRPQDAGGRTLSHVEYEAYAEMAEPEMERICREIRERWGISEVALIHRTGRVEPGQPSVVIAVAAGHRPEAFAACRYAIDRLKEIVPIWKVEVPSRGAQAQSHPQARA